MATPKANPILQCSFENDLCGWIPDTTVEAEWERTQGKFNTTIWKPDYDISTFTDGKTVESRC